MGGLPSNPKYEATKLLLLILNMKKQHPGKVVKFSQDTESESAGSLIFPGLFISQIYTDVLVSLGMHIERSQNKLKKPCWKNTGRTCNRLQIERYTHTEHTYA